jgi:hypothetical protein
MCPPMVYGGYGPTKTLREHVAKQIGEIQMKKFIKILLIVIAALVLVSAAFVLYVNVDFGEKSTLSAVQPQLDALSPQSVKVENVHQYTQPDAFTCGITTIAITSSFLNNADIPPQSLITKYSLGSGMKTEAFVDLLSKELPGYAVKYARVANDFELIKDIHTELAAGIPVPVFFGAENPYNKPWYDFHASVVVGLDLQKQQVDIVNAYGYMENITLTDFLDRMAYRNGSKYPFVQRAVAKLGLMDKNAMVQIVKN